VSEIRTWLDGIGLAQYANAFEANDIDIDLLGQVDDQVLKDIGVSSAGHRLRIRNAIAKLSPAWAATTVTELEEAKASVVDRFDDSPMTVLADFRALESFTILGCNRPNRLP
jgi:SAM domain (Sterile alpha motif)